MQIEPPGVTFAYPGCGYTSEVELLGEFRALAEQRAAWLLQEAGGPYAWGGLDEERREELALSAAYLAGRLAATAAGISRFRDMAALLALSEYETDAAALCLLAFREPGLIEAWFGEREKRVTPWLAARLFAPAGVELAGYALHIASLDRAYRLFAPLGADGTLALDARMLAHLLGRGAARVDGLAVLPPAPMEAPPIREGMIALMAPWLDAEGVLQRIIALSAPAGAGKRYLVCQALGRAGKPMVELDLRSILDDPVEGLRRAYTEMLLSGGFLVAVHFEALLDAEPAQYRAFFAMLLRMPEGRPAFLLSERPWKNPDIASRILLEEIELPELSTHERLRLFEHAGEGLPLADDADWGELAAKFRFTPGQVTNAVLQARERCGITGERASAALLHRCCYAQAVHRLDELATKVTPAYEFSDLVLPPEEIALLQQACRRVQHQHRVFHGWGFEKRISYGKGVSMLFSGPPGTGKTMAAQVIAHRLHMQLYQIQLSQVVSKYIGETEKNLRVLFEEARASSSILFFDECDALFGKRGEVKDGNDRYANIEVAYLLQQVEAHEGVSILATNLRENIDTAFMRRLSFVVQFPFPDAPMRKRLFRSMLPADTPTGADIDFDFLAELFQVSGGSIKNIVLHAAFEAAAEGVPLSMAHLLNAGVLEFRKNDILIRKEDLKEYADLVF